MAKHKLHKILLELKLVNAVANVVRENKHNSRHILWEEDVLSCAVLF